jgi:hypothetical protein
MIEAEIVRVLLAAALTSIGAIVVSIVKLSFKQGALELKVDTMWAFQMRRAVSEVVQTNVGTLNSPLKITADAKQRLTPIKKELETCWSTSWNKLHLCDVLMEIERLFGHRLLTLICVPCQMSHGACLIVALAVACGSDSIDFEGMLAQQQSK